MTGLEPYLGTIFKVGGAIIVKAPRGLEIIKSWWKGETILIIGQERAGKTTFLDYFHYGLWGDERETVRTLKDLPTARFNIKLGRDEALEICITTAIDTSGQAPHFQQAEKAFAENPHALLIFMDLSKPLKTSSEWLTELCKRLETYWRTNKRKRNRIQSIILVLNKKDKVDAKAIASRKKSFQKILDSQLKDARGKMLDDIAIMPTVIVTNPDNTKSVDNLIAHLAKSLIQ